MSEEQPPTPPTRRKGALAEAYNLHTASLSEGIGGRKPMPRREVTVTIDCGECAPGIFDEDFDLTLRASSSAEEQAVARKNANNQVGFLAMLAMKSMWRVNGDPIPSGQDEWLWEALGTAGRNIVLVAYQQLSMPSEEAAKKALGSLKISG